MSNDMMSHPARVVVIDDEGLIRESMTRLLQIAGFDSVAFESVEAFQAAHPDGPACDCMLVDVSLPGISGIEFTRRTTVVPDHPAIIMISGRSEVPQAVLAMKSGASDFLLKPLASDDVLASVRAAITDRWAETRMSTARRDALNRLDRLTRREREVLDLIVAGRLNKQMAVELGISQKTIEFHRARVMRKLDVTCMAELMRVAFLAGVRDLAEERAAPSAELATA